MKVEKVYQAIILVVWLGIISAGFYYGYNYIAEGATAWEEAHPEYCSYEYDYRCGQKNPWGMALFLSMIGYPLLIIYFSVKYHAGARWLWSKFVDEATRQWR